MTTIEVDPTDEASVRKAIAELEQMLPRADQAFFDRPVTYEEFRTFADSIGIFLNVTGGVWRCFSRDIKYELKEVAGRLGFRDPKKIILNVGHFCGECPFNTPAASTLFEAFAAKVNPDKLPLPDDWVAPARATNPALYGNS